MVQEFVVDTSVLVQGFITEADSARVQTLMRGLFASEPDILHIAEFGLLECTNILWKRVRLHGLPPSSAKTALETLLSTPLTVQPITALLPRALEIGTAHNLAVYDSLYIALSEKLRQPLITVDQRQIAVALNVGITYKPISDFPLLKAP